MCWVRSRCSDTWAGLGARSTSTSSALSNYRDRQLTLSCAQGLIDRAVNNSIRDDLDVTGHLAYLDLVLIALKPQAVLLLLWEQSGVLAGADSWGRPAHSCPCTYWHSRG